MEPLTLWAIDVPPPNYLRRGDIVWDTSEPLQRRSRGVVAKDATALQYPWGDVEIRLSASAAAITNNHHGNWQHIPEKQTTATERVRSLVLTWTEDDPNQESFEFHLLAALLPIDELEAAFDHGANSTTDMAFEVAALIDEEMA